jgi:hypothetical protein
LKLVNWALLLQSLMYRPDRYEDLDGPPGRPESGPGQGWSRARQALLLLSALGLLALGLRLTTGPSTVTLVTLPEGRLVKLMQEPRQEPEQEQEAAWQEVQEVSWAPAPLGHLPPPDTPDPKVTVPAAASLQVDPGPSPSRLGRYQYAAVSVDSIPCAKIGK